MKKRTKIFIAVVVVSALGAAGTAMGISLYKQSQPPEEETRTVTLYPVRDDGTIEDQAVPVDVTIRLIKRHYFFNQDDYAAVMDISGDRLYFNYDVEMYDTRRDWFRSYIVPRGGTLYFLGTSEPDNGVRSKWYYENNPEEEPLITSAGLDLAEDWSLITLAYVDTPYLRSEGSKGLESKMYIGPADSVEEARDRFRENAERIEEQYGTDGDSTA